MTAMESSPAMSGNGLQASASNGENTGRKSKSSRSHLRRFRRRKSDAGAVELSIAAGSSLLDSASISFEQRLRGREKVAPTASPP